MTEQALQSTSISATEKAFSVMGVRVHAVQIPDVVAQMESWIAQGESYHFIAVTGMHGVTVAQHEPRFKQILNLADLVVPDGMPLVWLGRHHGFALKRRVYGPELMQTFCENTGSKYRHFFYGGMPAVTTLLTNCLKTKHGINPVGDYSPPFRPLSKQEDEEIVARINAAKPDILWVGLSTPKQEKWMFEHMSCLRVPVVVGVGAAFDFLSGKSRQAPRWMREGGLEWFFRLLQEPRRLWRRYLIYGSQFALNASLEVLGIKKYS
jgi:N-acetylglucosaminyldiphosphoundecaprenol N-acetyl-beta-D-mannosaminyltransferase